METFNCHLCGCRKVGFDILAGYHDTHVREDLEEFGEYTTIHKIIKCRECEGIFYQQEASNLANHKYHQRLAVYPAIGNVEILKTLPVSIKKPYISAIKCMEAGITDAASTMLRKVVYMICEDKGVDKDLPNDERIKSLDIPQPIKDVLLNIKGIGDWGGHEDLTYSRTTLEQAKEALDLIIKFLYEFPETMNSFVKKTAQEKGDIVKKAKEGK